MNTQTGEIIPPEKFAQLPAEEKRKYIPIIRELTELERASWQIQLYAPCGCGSGKKFKFCCKK